jgi:hypothetical protein
MKQLIVLFFLIAGHLSYGQDCEYQKKDEQFIMLKNRDTLLRARLDYVEKQRPIADDYEYNTTCYVSGTNILGEVFFKVLWRVETSAGNQVFGGIPKGAPLTLYLEQDTTTLIASYAAPADTAQGDEYSNGRTIIDTRYYLTDAQLELLEKQKVVKVTMKWDLREECFEEIYDGAVFMRQLECLKFDQWNKWHTRK